MSKNGYPVWEIFKIGAPKDKNGKKSKLISIVFAPIEPIPTYLFEDGSYLSYNRKEASIIMDHVINRIRFATPLHKESGEHGIFVKFDRVGKIQCPIYITPSGIEFAITDDDFWEENCMR